LVIELDGDAHFSPTIEGYEVERTQYLARQGVKVIRFENRELQENIEAVIETIKQAVTN
jgi:very-short-patch-repair endonuclease